MTPSRANSASLTMPGVSELQRALRITTERLARELVEPSVEAPKWSQSEWVLARATAAIHGVAPLLSRVLRWRSPEGWREHLREQAAHTTARHVRILELLNRIDEHGRTDGIRLVALKGAALHSLALYAPGERPMADVDLLVHTHEEAGAIRALGRLAFRETCRTWQHRVFEQDASRANARFGEHAENPLKIELHTRIQEALPRRRVDITSQILTSLVQPGVNGYSSRAALMSHLLLHAAGAMAFRSLRIVQLCDISRLAALMTPADWDQLIAIQGHTEPWWAFPPLCIAARYQSSIPESVLRSFAVQCTWPLRILVSRQTITDVSLSHLRVSAFPGIEWAQAVDEAFAYVVRRAIPSHEVLIERNIAASGQLSYSDSPWASMSQARRVLEWINARAVRPQSMHPIREAFAQFGTDRRCSS